jgi:hypothetical protein
LLHVAEYWRDRSVRIAVVVIGGLALAALALITFAVNRPEPLSYVPTPPGELPPPDDSGARVVTINATSPDEWRFFSFEHGVLPGRAAGKEWDLAFRRFHIIANGGAGFTGRGGIAQLGPAPFDSVTATASTGFTPTTLQGSDSINAATARWYRYSFTSHLLMPLGDPYLVRSADGRHTFKMQILGYYCPGATPGCVTIRWAEV